MKRNTLRYLLFATLSLSAGLASAVETAAGPLLHLQHGWAVANYQTRQGQRRTAFERLAKEADQLIQAQPGRAEPLVWKGIVLSTEAGAVGGLGALSLAKEARALLQQAERIDPKALDGSIYTSMGTLYYKVPGWPLGFGDDDKAEANLKKALAINPRGIDPNYFYADFLYEQDRYPEAARYAQRALKAPDRPQRPVADQGRRAEIRALSAKINERLASGRKGGSLWN